MDRQEYDIRDQIKTAKSCNKFVKHAGPSKTINQINARNLRLHGEISYSVYPDRKIREHNLVLQER